MDGYITVSLKSISLVENKLSGLVHVVTVLLERPLSKEQFLRIEKDLGNLSGVVISPKYDEGYESLSRFSLYAPLYNEPHITEVVKELRALLDKEGFTYLRESRLRSR
jgi:hypothetical protein